MKIEMGESIIYSWLRHEKKCQIVQTNWKASPKIWGMEQSKRNELIALMEKAKEYYLVHHNYEVFKKTSSIDQLLKQAESDVIGIHFEDNISKIIAVEIAFHEGGLSYGDAKTTIMKVVSKMIRTAMCLYGFFGIKNADIVFASPMVQKNMHDDLIRAIDEAQKFLEDQGYRFELKPIIKDSFKEKILDPVCNLSDEVADDAELFLRSYKLIQVCNKKTK